MRLKYMGKGPDWMTRDMKRLSVYNFEGSGPLTDLIVRLETEHPVHSLEQLDADNTMFRIWNVTKSTKGTRVYYTLDCGEFAVNVPVISLTGTKQGQRIREVLASESEQATPYAQPPEPAPTLTEDRVRRIVREVIEQHERTKSRRRWR